MVQNSRRDHQDTGEETIAVLEDSIHVRMGHVRSCTIHCLKVNIIISIILILLTILVGKSSEGVGCVVLRCTGIR